jgi:hypothetical protein
MATTAEGQRTSGGGDDFVKRERWRLAISSRRGAVVLSIAVQTKRQRRRSAMSSRRKVVLVQDEERKPMIMARRKNRNSKIWLCTCIHMRVRGSNIYIYRRGRIYKEPLDKDNNRKKDNTYLIVSFLEAKSSYTVFPCTKHPIGHVLSESDSMLPGFPI